MMIAFSLCRAWQGDETASIHVSNIVGNVIVIPCFFFQLQSYGQWELSISVQIHFWTELNHLSCEVLLKLSVIRIPREF